MYKQAYYRGGAVMNKTKLQWEKLFSEDRERKTKLSYEIRNAFECDYDRIVGSSSVRRLQDKAQVFPLQENDFTRTRLTHSMEVSAIARSLGKQVGRELENRDKFKREDTEKLEALLQTTGLVHDLGNPPFGHYGEKAIGKWFEKYFMEKGLKKDQKQEEKPLRTLNLHHWLCLKKDQKQKEKPEIDITKEQMREFEHFDGNVQNIRILTKLQAMNDRYGANFTYATLAGIIKYPWAANDGKKKYGYYESEEKIIEKPANGKKTVVIDPGHGPGGNSEKEAQSPDSGVMKIKDGGGADGINSKTPEYVITMNVSLKLKSLLEANGINVIMTKEDINLAPGNIERAEVGNNNNADLAIRIHCDSADATSAKGASMLVPAPVVHPRMRLWRNW